MNGSPALKISFNILVSRCSRLPAQQAGGFVSKRLPGVGAQELEKLAQELEASAPRSCRHRSRPTILSQACGRSVAGRDALRVALVRATSGRVSKDVSSQVQVMDRSVRCLYPRRRALSSTLEPCFRAAALRCFRAAPSSLRDHGLERDKENLVPYVLRGAGLSAGRAMGYGSTKTSLNREGIDSRIRSSLGRISFASPVYIPCEATHDVRRLQFLLYMASLGKVANMEGS